MNLKKGLGWWKSEGKDGGLKKGKGKTGEYQFQMCRVGGVIQRGEKNKSVTTREGTDAHLEKGGKKKSPLRGSKSKKKKKTEKRAVKDKGIFRGVWGKRVDLQTKNKKKDGFRK